VGIPDGVINVVNGAGGEIAQRLITHPAAASFQTAIMMEKFHGTMPTTTPSG
jgi:acyl-CoA reductase-like NAD-dependent aldehyde dehydrogenase